MICKKCKFSHRFKGLDYTIGSHTLTHSHTVDSSHMVYVATPGVKFNIVKNVSVLGGPPPLYPQGFEVYGPAAPLPLCCREAEVDYLYPAAPVLTSGKVPNHSLVGHRN